MKSVEEWEKRNLEVKDVFIQALKDFKSESGEETFDKIDDMGIKGDLIAYNGCCYEFAEFLIDRLLEVIDASRIKVYSWEYIHAFVTVDDDIILDSGSCGVKFYRKKLDEIFLKQIAGLAVTLNEHYYIVSKNEKSIIYDPWGFVDNQGFNHNEYNLIPSKETVYTVEEFKKMRRKDG